MTKSKVGILGLGNLLLCDEGFGNHFVEQLQTSYTLPDSVEILDGGTAGIMLAPFIEDLDLLFIIDTVDIKAEPGSVHCFTEEDIRSGHVQMRMSPHQFGLLEIIDLCRLRDKVPQSIHLLTVVPEDLSTRIGLSEKVKARLPEIMRELLSLLDRYNIEYSPKEQAACA
jgi:hydrogenase maturation protease